jgi:hypothetical protein
MRKGAELPENQQELVIISPSFTGIHLEDSNQASDVLTYENLDKAVYTSAHDKENPYEVKRIAGYFLLERKEANNIHPNSSYKIHISVDDSSLSQAWNTIISILIEAKIDSFKVHDGDMHGFQPGKNIVIYTDIYDNRVTNNSLEDFKKLLKDINHNLQIQGIKPGIPSCFRFNHDVTNISEPKFEESNYCYIRRSVDPKESCCGLCNTSERELITRMSEDERCGLLTSLRSTPKPQKQRMR